METNFKNGDELIIVNDYSTDNTAGILLALKEKYPGIHIITHKRNKGGAAARNTAVENAEHELLFCLDADNVLAPLSIEPLKQFLLDNNADVASFQNQHFFLNDKTQPEYIWSLPPGEFNITGYISGQNTPGQHGNYLFTKRSWANANGYAEGTGALDTWTFGLRQAITGAKMVVLKDTFYHHRLDHQNSYWMQDAEAKLWSVSVKATHALFPFFDRIDEKYLDYMLGKGRYSWYYNLKKKNLKLVEAETKSNFYKEAHNQVREVAYPPTPFFKRVLNKIKRSFNGSR